MTRRRLLALVAGAAVALKALPAAARLKRGNLITIAAVSAVNPRTAKIWSSIRLAQSLQREYNARISALAEVIVLSPQPPPRWKP